MSDDMARDELIAAARRAMAGAYAPYSGFQIGAALRFADGSIVTGTNIENASYGLSLCAETVAVAKAMDDGHRGGLEAVAVYGAVPQPVTPCGRCRQILSELAQLGDTDPVVWCANGSAEGAAPLAGGGDVLELNLSQLLPHAFGPRDLG